MATVTWDSGVTSKGQADGVSYTYTNTNFATQLNTIPPYAKINSVKITAKFKVNLYTNNGGLTVGSKTWTVGNTDNHNWITIVENEDITSYLTGGSGAENAGALPNITVYANKRMGFARTFQTQVTITWDYSHTHSYTLTATKAATCTETGVRTFTCSCGASYTETIPATGHSYTSAVTAPTCTAQGYTTHTCSICDYSYKDTYTAALGHTAGSTVVENKVEATCTVDGSYDNVVYCTVCGAEISRETVTVPALGHSYTSKVIAPTGSSKGYTRHTCSRCGHYYDDNYTCLITTVSEPSEGGTVTGGGIYSEGASVTLTAIPNENYYIGGWYKDGEAITDDFSFGEAITDPSIEVSADDCATYTVEFYLNEYIVIVNEGENGSITVFTAEGDSFEGENALVFYHGTEITLTAVPDEGYKFVSFQITENEDVWDDSIGDISDIIGYHYENPFTLTVTGHFKVYAVFEEAALAPEISDVQMIYSGSQISPTHKVPAGEYFILKAMIK